MDTKSLLFRTLQKYFNSLEEEAFEQIIENIKLVDIDAGTHLFELGSPSNELYFVLYGKLQAHLPLDEDNVEILGDIFHGETIGEMGLLTGEKRKARVIALRSSRIAVLDNETFQKIYTKSPASLLGTLNVLVDRLDRSNRRGIEKSTRDKVITITRCSDLAHTQKFGTNLASEIQKDSDSSLVDIKTLVDDKALTKHIYQNENKFPYCFIESTSETSAQMGLHSDTIVFIGDEYHISEVSNACQRMAKNKEHWRNMAKFLIMVYDEGSKPNINEEWMNIFNPSQIIKVRSGNDSDLKRALRLVTGRGNGLVLSGGGTHGFAHLGVMQALKEENIPIDFIGGTSIGAIMGAGLSLDWEMDEILEKVKKEISENNPLNDYTIPVVALLKGKRMRRSLRNHFDMNIQDSWINYFCIGSNYLNAEVEVFDRGSMFNRIASSISIPGILPPSIVNKSYILDGGVLENVPLQSMKKVFDGNIITVDLSSVKDYKVDYREIPSGTKLFFSKFNPFRKKVRTPKLMNVIMKSFTLSSINKRGEFKANSDLYINPQVKKGFLEWSAFHPIVKTGYLAAKESLTEEKVEKLRAIR